MFYRGKSWIYTIFFCNGNCREMSGIVGKCREMLGNVGWDLIEYCVICFLQKFIFNCGEKDVDPTRWKSGSEWKIWPVLSVRLRAMVCLLHVIRTPKKLHGNRTPKPSQCKHAAEEISLAIRYFFPKICKFPIPIPAQTDRQTHLNQKCLNTPGIVK